MFIEVIVTRCKIIPQICKIIKDGYLILVAAKRVDDILATGEQDVVNDFINGFSAKFKVGTVGNGRGYLRFYVMNIVHNEDYACSINADDYLQALEKCPIPILRRREGESNRISVYKSDFLSLNSSLGCLVIASRPFCASYSGHLQQQFPSTKVSVLSIQSNAPRILKRLYANIAFSKPSKGQHNISIGIFSDAARTPDHGQWSFRSVFFDRTSIYEPSVPCDITVTTKIQTSMFVRLIL